MPGQHIAGGETPTWLGRQHRLHHALRFGDEMWASCWHGGFRIVDVSDLTKPKTKGGYNYHPLFPEPTHTAMPVPKAINGKRIALAVDEEDQAQSANEEQMRRGRAHACILTFDVTDMADIKPLGQFQVSELDLPFARTAGARFGAHQFCERMSGTICFATWFGGGLRIVDVGNPLSPREVGHFIPEPAGGRARRKRNDVALDAKGLAYIVDRYVGFDVLEFAGRLAACAPWRRYAVSWSAAFGCALAFSTLVVLEIIVPDRVKTRQRVLRRRHGDALAVAPQ